MSSWTFETYKQGDTYVEYRWDKYCSWVMFVGKRYVENGLIQTIYENTYPSKESAKRAFQRVVRKLKKGEY